MSAWPTLPLAAALEERKNRPTPENVFLGTYRIVSKISFETGKIHFRPDAETKTGMILVQPGDLLVSGINAYKGAVAIYEGTGPAVATIHYGAYRVRPEMAERRFVWWLLRSHRFQQLLEEHVPGGIKTELKAKRLLPIPVPVPPLAEQRRLVERIEAVAAKIDEAHRLKAGAQLLAKSAVEGLLESVMPPLESLGKFGEVIVFKPRSGPSFLTDLDWRGTPVLMPSAVTGFGVDPRKVEYGPGQERISPKDRLEPGDILIARGNKREQVGNAGIVPEKAKGWVCANLLMRLQVDPRRVHPRFCIFWLRSPRMRHYVREHMTGTSPNIQKVNQATILNYPFPTHLSVARQAAIVDSVERVEDHFRSLRSLQREAATELDALLPAVLDRAFRGDL